MTRVEPWSWRSAPGASSQKQMPSREEDQDHAHPRLRAAGTAGILTTVADGVRPGRANLAVNRENDRFTTLSAQAPRPSD